MNYELTPEELRQLAAATEFKQLVPVGVGVVARIGSGIHEVCGPITTGGFGCPKKNLAFFGFAIEELWRRGIPVFDVRPYQDAMDRIIEEQNITDYPWALLEEFYGPVFESGHIVKGLFLPDWQTSKGANWERQKLTSLGIPVEPFPSEWLVEFKMPDEIAS